MRIAALLVFASMLAACGPVYKIDTEYYERPAIAVSIAVPNSSIRKLNVRFLPSDPPRANVKPTINRIAWENASAGPNTWIANMDVVKPVYIGALNQALKQQGRKCGVIDSRIFPDSFMIDFTLDCSDQHRE